LVVPTRKKKGMLQKRTREKMWTIGEGISRETGLLKEKKTRSQRIRALASRSQWTIPWGKQRRRSPEGGSLYGRPSVGL